jgi:hypothetical protein
MPGSYDGIQHITSGADKIRSSLEMVHASAGYVCLIGWRYGEPPECAENPERLSLTELEFNEAVKLELPILVFVMNQSHPITRKDARPMDEVEELIDRALAFVDVSRMRGEEVFIGDDFQIRPMYGTLALWDLFAEDAPIQLSGEIRQELSAWLNRATLYIDCDDWPVGADDIRISIADEACVTLGATAQLLTKTAAGPVTLHFVGDEAGRKQFWRAAILLEGDNKESLIRNAPHAYPDLCFIDGVLENADELSGGYSASRHLVQSALAVLDDWGHWVFTFPPPAITPHEGASDTGASPNNQLIEKRFLGLGLTAAPEKPNVRGHRVSREARETVLGKRVLYCEWHVKLELHKNRVHVHAPVPESRNKVVVGMIDEHLPLPP